MAHVTFTSRAFNQSINQAKKAALIQPVVVTDRGQPAHVLLSYAQYQQLIKQPQGVMEALAMQEASDLEFEPVKLELGLNIPGFDD